MRSTILLALLVVSPSCSKSGAPPPPIASSTIGEQQLLHQCDVGTNAACEELETVYLRRGRKDQSTALVKRLCESGRRYFCPSYAFVLDQGGGVARDRVHAHELFEQTCEADPKACSEFGSLYLAGTKTMAQDIELGCFLAIKACGLGDQDACRDATASHCE